MSSNFLSFVQGITLLSCNLQIVLDYNDYMRIPVINDLIKKSNEEGIRLR